MVKSNKSSPMFSEENPGDGQSMFTKGSLNSHWNYVEVGVGPRLESLSDNIGEELTEYLDLFLEGEMSELNSRFNYDKQQDITSKVMSEMEKGGFSNEYTKLLLLVTRFNEALAGGTTQYKVLQSEMDDLIRQRENPNPVDPADSEVMLEEAAMSTSGSIRPEIAIYIKRYGVPQNFVFDSIKLKQIKDSL